jgi:hypothetical protein
MKNGEEPNTEAFDPEFDEFDKKPSSLPNVSIDLSGFATEDEARRVGEAIQGYLYLFGKILNMERLHRVIVPYDYDGELARLERGVAGTAALRPTKDEFAVGIAMTPAIIEKGEARSVMVLNAYHMIVLAHPDNPEVEEHVQRIVHTLAHECGHVHDLGVQVKCFPDTILKPHTSYKDGVLFGIAYGCWQEYIASRLSAFMGKDFTTSDFEETFCGALEGAKERADAAIRQYRMHGDVNRIVQEVTTEYKRPLIHASYLLGHVDGLGGTIQALAPKASDAAERSSYFNTVFIELAEELRSLYSTYGKWQTLEVYEPLKLLAHDLLKTGGIDIQQMPDGTAHVDIPRQTETLPSLREQSEFMLSKMARKTPS